MKITAIIWSSYYPIFRRAADSQKLLDITVFSSKSLENDSSLLETALSSMEDADLLFFYRASEGIWEEIDKRLKDFSNKKIISLGYDQAVWKESNVEPEILKTCYEFIVYGGDENFKNLLFFLAKEVLGLSCSYKSPEKLPWDGIYHPDAKDHFETIDSYLSWYKPKDAPTIGLLFSRHYWVNNNLDIEDSLIREIEKRGFNVIPVFTQSIKDKALGNKGALEVVKEFFFTKDGSPRIDALIKMLAFFIGLNKGDEITDPSSATTGVDIFKRLNCPVFQPIVSYYKSIEEWEKDPQGLGQDVGWSIAMPEFEGVIEPIIIGGTKKPDEKGDLNKNLDEYEIRIPIKERCEHLIDRVSKWIKLRQKPISERRVVFILHNNPCASVEATVGSGAHLDTLESVTRILKRMKQAGYKVDVPASGKERILLMRYCLVRQYLSLDGLQLKRL